MNVGEAQEEFDINPIDVVREEELVLVGEEA